MLFVIHASIKWLQLLTQGILLFYILTQSSHTTLKVEMRGCSLLSSKISIESEVLSQRNQPVILRSKSPSNNTKLEPQMTHFLLNF